MENIQRRLTSKILLCLFSVLLICPLAFASSEVGKISYTEGRVDVLRADSGKIVPLREGELIFVGDILRTKSNSKTEVSFYDKSIIQLAQNTRLEITEYKLGEDNIREAASILVQRGKVRTIIEKYHGVEPFAINTPNARGTIKGSDVFAFYQGGTSGMLVNSGNLAVVNLAQPELPPVMIPPGNSVVIPLEEQPKGPRPFLEIEEKFHEQDTTPPPSIARRKNLDKVSGAITKFSGDVRITKKGVTTPRVAKLNDILNEGDVIETGADGMIEMKFDNGNAINMKPNSRLVISRLIIDSTNGEFENSFELSMGKVRARVENLKGDSSFQIKTPVAVCGVRGTIMVVETTNEETKTFFEGGFGFVRSLISSQERKVGIGENSTADNKGKVSIPKFTTQKERMQMGGGWEPGSGIEGYSSPEGTTGFYLYDPETGITRIDGEAAEEFVKEIQERGDIPEEIFDELIIPELPPLPPEGIGLRGFFDASFGYYDQEESALYLGYGSMAGTVLVEGNLWESAQPVTLSGTFEIPEGNYPLLGSNAFTATGNDGAAFLGVIGGLNENALLQAGLYSFYIREDAGNYYAGYVRSMDIEGALDESNGTFDASGTLSVGTELERPTSLTPDDLYNESSSLITDTISPLSVGGDISGITTDDSTVSRIEDQLWGIWKLSSGGTYETTPSNDWNAVMGSVAEDDGYSLLNITGDFWSDNIFSGQVNGKNMNVDDFYMGIVQGEMVGTYQEYEGGTWQAISLGIKAVQPMAFGGSLDGSFGFYNSDIESVDFATDSSIDAVFGGTTDLNIANSALTIIGESTDAVPQSVWAATDQFNIQGRTADNGTILGSVGGVYLEDDLLLGLMYALYIRPDTSSPTGYTAGYVKSTDLSGNFYSDIDMFEAEGTLTSYFESPTTVTPDQLYDGSPYLDQYSEPDVALFSGDTLSGHGEVIGETLIGDQDWGIIRVSAGGTYSSLPSDPNNWHAVTGMSYPEGTESNYSIGHYNGEDWSDGKLSGTITGGYINYDPENPFHLGDLNLGDQGDFIGTYGDGQWQSIGFVAGPPETSLQLGGYFDGEFAEYDEGELGNDNGSVNAVLGSTESPWGGTIPLIVMGQYSNPEDQNLWTDVNYIEVKTLDGATFMGVMGGTGNGNGSLHAGLLSFYIRPDASSATGYRAGYVLSNDLVGSYYDDLGMFELDGSLTHYLDYSTIYSPSDLYDLGPALGERDENPGLIGSSEFSGSINIDANGIEDQEWRLWWGSAGGNYSSLPSDGWQAATGGFSGEVDGVPGTARSYYLGIITGNAWSNNEFDGTTNGEVLDIHTLATFSGDMLGVYDTSDSTWEALTLGAAVDEGELTSSGNLKSVIAYGNGETTEGFDGLVGIKDSIWDDGLADFISIGQFESFGHESFVWRGGRQSFFSYDYDETDPQYITFTDGGGHYGAFYGISAGIGFNDGSDDILEGFFSALYIDDAGNAGVFHSGRLAGNFIDDVEMYRLDGDLWINYDLQVSDIGILPENLINSLSWDDVVGTPNGGGFNPGGDIELTAFSGTMINIVQQNWGISEWYANGTYTTPISDDWQLLDLTGMTTSGDESIIGGSWLGGINGTQWSNNVLDGELNSVWVRLRRDGTLSGNKVNSHVMGTYVEVAEGATWNAATVSEWVEVDTLLDLTGQYDDITDMAGPNIPITEVYTSLLSGSGMFSNENAISLTMNMNFYVNDDLYDFTSNGIWASKIDGTYETPTTPTWSANVSGNLINSETEGIDGTINATLNGTSWGDGYWQADVTGSVSNDITFQGVTAGTYADGELTGAGTGTFETQ